MYTKLVLIAAMNFEDRMRILFGIDELLSYGVDVEFWDVSKITYDYPKTNGISSDIKQRYFEDRSTFKKTLLKEDIHSTLFIVYVNYNFETAFVFRSLSNEGCDMAYCVNGVLPTPNRAVIERIKTANFGKFFKNRLFSLLKQTSLYRPLKYQLLTCTKAETDYKICDKTILVPFNSTDYMKSLTIDGPVINGPYIVFIDMYLPLHPDTRILGWNPVPVDEYYAGMNRFFDKIERETGCKVVIAAHPAAKKYKEKNYFNGREVYFLKTENLVRYSVGVIDHCSTAISFAVLFNKPIITIVSEGIKKKMPILYQTCQCFSDALQSKFINVDQEGAVNFGVINETAYEEYKKNYIYNPGTNGLTNGKILFSIMKGEYDKANN